MRDKLTTPQKMMRIKAMKDNNTSKNSKDKIDPKCSVIIISDDENPLESTRDISQEISRPQVVSLQTTERSEIATESSLEKGRSRYSIYEDWRLLESLDEYMGINGTKGSKSVNLWEVMTDPLTGKRVLGGMRSAESMKNRVLKTLNWLTRQEREKVNKFMGSHDAKQGREHYLKFEKDGRLAKKFVGIFKIGTQNEEVEKVKKGMRMLNKEKDKDSYFPTEEDGQLGRSEVSWGSKQDIGVKMKGKQMTRILISSDSEITNLPKIDKENKKRKQYQDSEVYQEDGNKVKKVKLTQDCEPMNVDLSNVVKNKKRGPGLMNGRRVVIYVDNGRKPLNFVREDEDEAECSAMEEEDTLRLEFIGKKI